MPWQITAYPPSPKDLLGIVETLRAEPIPQEPGATDIAAFTQCLLARGYGDALGAGAADLPEEALHPRAQEILSFLERLGWMASGQWTGEGAAVRDGPSLSRALQKSLLRTEGEALLATCELITQLQEEDPDTPGVLLPEFTRLAACVDVSKVVEQGSFLDQILVARHSVRQTLADSGMPYSEQAARMGFNLHAALGVLEDEHRREAEDRLELARITLQYCVATGLLTYLDPLERVQVAGLAEQARILFINGFRPQPGSDT